MKITPEDYKKILEIVRQAKPKIENFPLLTNNKRNRWDCLWLQRNKSLELIKHIYSYANDTHIDTALRRAFIEVFGIKSEE